jgi:hypothetical protein
MHADVLFIGQGEHEGALAVFATSERWYAKACTFKRSGGTLAPFHVGPGGALALDSCSFEDTRTDVGQYGCDSIARCTYKDGSPVTGMLVSLSCAQLHYQDLILLT